MPCTSTAGMPNAFTTPSTETRGSKRLQRPGASETSLYVGSPFLPGNYHDLTMNIVQRVSHFRDVVKDGEYKALTLEEVNDKITE